MLAVIENRENSKITLISAIHDDRLRFQIEKLLESNISATVWAKLYVDMETVDLGRFMITLFEVNSILEFKPVFLKPSLSVTREDHNLKPRD